VCSSSHSRQGRAARPAGAAGCLGRWLEWGALTGDRRVASFFGPGGLAA
jgi:hypothetical protein